MSEAKNRDTSDATHVGEATIVLKDVLAIVERERLYWESYCEGGSRHDPERTKQDASDGWAACENIAGALQLAVAFSGQRTNSDPPMTSARFGVAYTQSAPELRTTAAIPAWRCDHSIREVSPDGKRCLACERDLCASDATSVLLDDRARAEKFMQAWNGAPSVAGIQGLIRSTRERSTDYAPAEVTFMAKWIDGHTGSLGVYDHACATCIPGGEIVVPGFECAVHIARRILAGQKRSEG